MENGLDRAREAATELRLTNEGLCELLEDVIDKTISGEADAMELVPRLQVCLVSARACLGHAETVDDVLADL